MIVTRALGLPIRPVVGYDGMANIRHAIDGGEVVGACLGLAAFNGTFTPTSDYVVVLQAGVERAAGLEQVDLVVAATHGGNQEALARLLMLVSSVGRYYAFPPETPAHLVDVMADAFAGHHAGPRVPRGCRAGTPRHKLVARPRGHAEDGDAAHDPTGRQRSDDGRVVSHPSVHPGLISTVSSST